MLLDIQGGELARKSVLQKGDAYLKYYYADAKTMYESFLRGCRVSSKYIPLQARGCVDKGRLDS